MKKFFSIFVLLLTLGGNAFASKMVFNCELDDAMPNKKDYSRIIYIIDTERNFFEMNFIWKGEQRSFTNLNGKIGSFNINGSNIRYRFDDISDEYGFNFGSDSFVDEPVKVSKRTPAQRIYCTKDAATKNQKKIEIADMINKSKDTCKSLGFKEGTEKFADCSLKLYSQSVELAAEQKQTVVMQPQSSGSNVMTIYDPVRDSNALMNKGMKMLSGGCTLGIDC
tara:strand:+ start:1365 stop:2033 length:669 start_codon:yes stop_codon:yes gene_type:complete